MIGWLIEWDSTYVLYPSFMYIYIYICHSKIFYYIHNWGNIQIFNKQYSMGTNQSGRTPPP